MKQLKTTIDKAQVTSLCADAISELERAVRLFPTWPSKLHVMDNPKFDDAILEQARFTNDSGASVGESIFIEEWIEFLQASRKPGNKVAARIELVQAMAMLIRIGCHLNDYVPHRATESTEVKS
jgi:hypothetical protein